MTERGTASPSADTARFAELEHSLQLREQEIQQYREIIDEQQRLMQEQDGRIGALEASARRKRFTEMVLGRDGEGDGAQWFGEVEAKVRLLESMADHLDGGEENPGFVAFVADQRAAAKAIRESGAFSELGTDHAGEDAPATATERLEQVAKERVDGGFAKDLTEGLIQAAELHPDWYAEHDEQVKLGRPMRFAR